MSIDLSDNYLTASSFALNSLSNFKRPTKLDLSGNQIEYLDEKVFKPYFGANQINTITISQRYFDANHYKNEWNQNYTIYKDRIINN